ncbi:MAG: hypothetical protein ACYC6M_12170 [Terriglobales bacterium]
MLPPDGNGSAFPWKAIGIGVGVTALLLGLLLLGSRLSNRPPGHPDAAYAAQLQVDDLKMSAAATMMAGDVTYLDATLHNNGNRPVAALTIELTFSDTLGQTVQRERETVVSRHSGPLGAHSSRAIRLGFDHISTEWNQGPPQIKVLAVRVE